jgi:tetrahydromethanopterin S-methyltransferase subunit G
MAVMMPREKWTDERLDDLNKKVDDGFAEMRQGFARVDEEFKELQREIHARFESLNRNLQATMVAVIVALIGSNAF